MKENKNECSMNISKRKALELINCICCEYNRYCHLCDREIKKALGVDM